MKKSEPILVLIKKIAIPVILLISQLALSQARGKIAVRSDQVTLPSCKCSELGVNIYMYYQDPANPTTSNYLLRFDFHRQGVVKCKPEFIGEISLGRNATIWQNFVASDLTSLYDTDGQRTFIIPQSLLTTRFGTIDNRSTIKVVYSLKYGPTSVCPAKSSKLVKFQKSEPIL